MSNALWSLVDLVLVYFGIYSFYIAYKMKRTGEIIGKIFLIPDTSVEGCKDKEGYIYFITPKILTFGIFATLMGGIGLIGDYFFLINSFLILGLSIIFLGILIWLARSAQKANKNFW